MRARREDSFEFCARSHTQQEAINAMLEYSWRLISQNGETRHQEKLTLSAAAGVWPRLADIADRFGKPGEVLQVIDGDGEMIIRMGVATARSVVRRPR